MRLDRSATLHLAYPLSRLRNRQGKARIPILMYHSIGNEIGSRHPYYETNTSPQVFEHQMRLLCEGGYNTLTLEEAVNSLQARTTAPKSVVITFDDGYRDFYTAAYPVLCKFKMTATVFVVSGVTGLQRSRFKERECLTWSEVREVRAHRIVIGSHTVNHPELKMMGRADIDDEIGRSKQTIEEKIGAPVKAFSYPYAFPESNHALIELLRQSLEKYGYENGVSTIVGTAERGHDRFFLPRLPINTWDDSDLFQAKLEGGYNWLHSVQYVKKFVKSRIW